MSGADKYIVSDSAMSTILGDNVRKCWSLASWSEE
jgi:hypothetical protein